MTSIAISRTRIFGSEYQTIEDNTEIITDSDTYVSRSTLTTSNLKGGTYRLEISYLGQGDTPDASLDLHILQDESTIIFNVLEEPRTNATSSAMRIPRVLVLEDIVLGSGVHTFEILFRSSTSTGGPSTRFAQMNFSKITLFRVK